MRFFDLLILVLFINCGFSQSNNKIDKLVDLNKTNAYRAEEYPGEFFHLNLESSKTVYYDFVELYLAGQYNLVYSNRNILKNYFSIYNVQAIYFYIDILNKRGTLTYFYRDMNKNSQNPIDLLVMGYSCYFLGDFCKSKYFFNLYFEKSIPITVLIEQDYEKINVKCLQKMEK